ncbi:hypothetical protein HUE56_05225 (plasmid) [Azospirillum oryzae]|uniref:Uncharacterized protein n=1 Tax=Azospirillum oryzae TaxID=286727 RepID=A0A6N1AFD7_9PROT|nr:hypothetical protein [Azospirillum oryzae]KAA0588579.1 hypothetical protein FZ938_11950 [Azospirillum oryzae]QKS49929.1 hypothetical protein HUE56_05225 [Azospirillum oryzae]GLR82771.1 hypothetical protein GCM10007856_54730 [Azospirillum oryzae]
MEIRGVSSTTAIRPTAFQPTEAGSASASPAADSTGGTADGGTDKASGPGYISPFLRYDQGARVAVLYFRDFDTGETQDQIPSQRVVEEYRRTASRLAQEDERKSAAAKTETYGSADGSTGSTGASSGSGYTPATGDSGLAGTSIGVSFASASGGGGTAAGTSAAAPTTGGFTPAATGGRSGGSPGGLVSVTV